MKDRSWKKFGIIFGILAIVLILVVLIFPKLIDLNRYNGLIVSEVEKVVGGKVKLGRISWGISRGIWLEIDGFSILDASAFPGDVKLSRIYANVSIPPLLTKKVVLNKFLLESTEVKMRLEPGKANDPKDQGSADELTPEPKEKETKAGVEAQPGAPPSKASGTIDIGLPAASPQPASFQLPVKIEIEKLVIKVDRLEIDDALTIPGQTQVRVYKDVDIAATHIVPGEEMAFNLALRAGDTSGLGALRAQGSFSGLTDTLKIENPNLKLKQAKLGPLSLPTINIRATNIANQPKVALRVKGPMQVVATSDAKVEKILMKHGLKSLTGLAEIDMSADYDQRRPKNWTANGLLVLKGVRAEAHPANVVMDNLQGEIKFNRKKTINITAQDITARINQAPVRLSGEFFGIGTPKMLVSAKAYAKQLDLAHLAELLPALRDLKLGGILDMDLDVNVPYSTPAKSRLNGTVTARNAGFQVAASDLTVEKGNAEIELNGNTANIKAMTMLVNDQQVVLSGHISNPVRPKVQLLIRSSDLNLDRLLPQDKAGKPSSKPSKDKEGQIEKKPVPEEKIGETELPPLARKLTADLQVKADRGQYAGFQFQNLKLNLFYERGVIKNYDINFEINDGHIATKGSADLRNLDHIPFTVAPDINALPLEKVAPLIGIDKLPLNGPMSLKGRLRGHTGSSKELLASLDGDLNAEIGPGVLNKIGKVGDLFVKILSMTSIRDIFSGSMIENLSSEGIPFQSIKTQTSFAKGTLNLNNLDFDSKAMNVNSLGTIDLINQELNIEAILAPFETVDKAFNFIPIVGETAEDLTKIYIDIKGPLENPKIRAAPIKGLTGGVKDVVKKPVEILKDSGKNLKKIF